MTIYNFLTLVGGLAMFLFGMDVMGKSLEKMGELLMEIVKKTYKE